MKPSAFIIGIALMLCACGHTQVRTEEVALPDRELESADPGQKEQKGDPVVSVNVDEPVGAADVVDKSDASGTSASRVTDTTKKIIKEGDISFETIDIGKTRSRILSTLKKLGGYVTDDRESTNDGDNRKEYTLQIRIPAKSFDVLVDSVTSGVKQIDSKNIRIKDVTTQFIDISTRLANKKLLEGRYLQLLKQASKMTDILAVENKLNEIRTEIESTQGQLNYLSKQVAYSSLGITFYSKAKAKAVSNPGFAHRFKISLVKGWDFLQRLFYNAIACWPILIVCLLIYLLRIRYLKRKSSAAV